MNLRIATAAFAAACTASSYAALLAVGGADVRIFNPINVTPGVVQSNFVNVFAEKDGIKLADRLILDHVKTGLVDQNSDLVPGFVPEGVTVDSFFIHFDPTGTKSREGYAEFDQEIIGVIIDNNNFNASTPILGIPTNIYGTASGAYGLELSANDERFEIAGGRKRIGFKFTASDPGDRIRVITTSAVPEPGTLGAIVAGAAALFGRRRKR